MELAGLLEPELLELLVLLELEEVDDVAEGLPLAGASDRVLLEGGGLLEPLRLATGGSGRELLSVVEVEGGFGVDFRVLLLLLLLVPSMIAISD